MTTTNKQTEKESNTQVVKNAKYTAAKTILNDVLSRLNNEGIAFKGMKGGSNDIYKSELFKDCLPEEKKRIRIKIRKMRDFHAMLVKDNPTQKNCQLFDEFYRQIYAVNDYSINSICTGKTDVNTRNILEKVLSTVKTTLKK